MNKKMLSRIASCIISGGMLFAQVDVAKADSKLLMMITPVLSGKEGAVVAKKEPSLAMMVAKDTDKIELAWVPGSDGSTPVDQIKYELHLSTSENFTPSSATLNKTVTGISQTEISGLSENTLYYGKIIAVYSNSSSAPSNHLQTKTYKNSVQLDPSATVAVAANLGLGKHTTTDGITYIYNNTTGNPPAVSCFLKTHQEKWRCGGLVRLQSLEAQ